MPADPQTKIYLRKLGAAIREARVSEGITQETLAELTQLNPRTIQKIEVGQTNILVTTLARIHSAVRCDWHDLMPKS